MVFPPPNLKSLVLEVGRIYSRDRTRPGSLDTPGSGHSPQSSSDKRESTLEQEPSPHRTPTGLDVDSSQADDEEKNVASVLKSRSNHLQISAIIGVPETQLEESQSFHGVPMFDEGDFSPSPSSRDDSHKLVVVAQDTPKISIVARMKPASAKRKVEESRETPHSMPSPDPRVQPSKPRRVDTKSRKMRPLPMLSPSAFRPYLPDKESSQESIEQFSSPERIPKQKPTDRDPAGEP